MRDRRDQDYNTQTALHDVQQRRRELITQLDNGDLHNAREFALRELRTDLLHDVKTVRERVINDINMHGEHWARKMDAALNAVIDRAIERGDPQALVAVWDRLIGKPTERLTIDVDRERGVEDIMSRLEQNYGEVINGEITEKKDDGHNPTT